VRFLGFLAVMQSGSEIPPPEQRLCKRHNKPIKPSNWVRRNRNRGCSQCDNERNRINGAAQRKQLKKNYKRIVEGRARLSSGMSGIELFNRSIGYNLISPTGVIQI
jgi:hypothetical protein